jgi:hypothetical protein
MKSIYCTVMSRPFVPRALTLRLSIARHAPDALFAFFCIEDATAALLRTFDLKNALVLAPGDFETPELRAIKPTLTASELCWTCKSVALQHSFATMPGLEWAVWVDADMFAFGNPDDALLDYADADVLLTPHRFAWPEIAGYEPSVGRFNAGYVAFRNTEGGRAILDWWRARCFESCSAAPTGDKYADQKYLERVPGLFPNVAESALAGLNCAPWNIIGQVVERNNDGIRIANSPLLLYHFQGFRVMRPWAFDFYASKAALPKIVKNEIYRPYAKALIAQMRIVARQTATPSFGVDGGFAGAGGLCKLALNLARSPNMAFQFSGTS